MTNQAKNTNGADDKRRDARHDQLVGQHDARDDAQVPPVLLHREDKKRADLPLKNDESGEAEIRDYAQHRNGNPEEVGVLALIYGLTVEAIIDVAERFAGISKMIIQGYSCDDKADKTKKKDEIRKSLHIMKKTIPH